MRFSRRNFLLGGSALLASPLAYLGVQHLLASSAETVGELQAKRFVNPLRLPGQDGVFTPVSANTLSRLTALPVDLPLRGRHATKLWAYQAEVTGKVVLNPILMARPGDHVALAFENRIPQPSIIHWHGFTNDGRNDGAGMTMAQPGANYDYDWTVRNKAAVNWYHPHPHQKAGEQTWRGMSGFFLVEDESSDRLASELGVQFGMTDIPLVIQDRTLERSGSMDYSDNPKRQFHGMSGNSILVNLTRFPVVTLPRRWIRFRILNGSNARNYRLAFEHEGRHLPFMLLGTDSQLGTTPLEIREIFLSAAQRIDIAIDLRQAAAGDIWLKTLPFDPMHNEMGSMDGMSMNAMSEAHVHGAVGEGADEPILRIAVQAYEGKPGKLPAQIADKVPTHETGPVRDFFLDHDGEGSWRINKKTFQQAHLAFNVVHNAREVWRIKNDTASMPHPMHLHGFSFAVLNRQGTPEQLKSLIIDAQGRMSQDLGRMDTVLVWPGETVNIAVDLSHPFAGEQSYMFHCHNLEHEDLGMMLSFLVSA